MPVFFPKVEMQQKKRLMIRIVISLRLFIAPCAQPSQIVCDQLC
jgi:hypothetical protein